MLASLKEFIRNQPTLIFPKVSNALLLAATVSAGSVEFTLFRHSALQCCYYYPLVFTTVSLAMILSLYIVVLSALLYSLHFI